MFFCPLLSYYRTNSYSLLPSVFISISMFTLQFAGDLIHYLYQVEDVQNMKSELTNLEVKLKEVEML
jgi:hypothetical protein